MTSAEFLDDPGRKHVSGEPGRPKNDVSEGFGETPGKIFEDFSGPRVEFQGFWR